MSRSIRRKALVGLATAAAVVATFAVPASASTTHHEQSGGSGDWKGQHHNWKQDKGGEKHDIEAAKTVADGLNGVGGFDFGRHGLYVAEGSKGQATKIDPKTGSKSAAVIGLTNPSGVAFVDGKLVIATAGSEVPDTKTTGDSSVFVAEPGKTPRLLADLKQYEIDHNPDGQLQFDPKTHEPLDSLSNPFAIIAQRGGYVLVADAGANAVLSINREGDVSLFFLPPLVTTGACAGKSNNDPQHVGCDPVPTGLAYGPNGDLYVSTLSSLVPGEGRVYVLNPKNGHIKDVIKGLDSPTGVAVDNCGNVYVSEVTFGGPEGEGPPPPGFDASKVGRIVKIDTHGNRTYAAVTLPLGLNFHDGSLYSGAWSIADQFGMPDKGQVVRVNDSAFK